MAIFLRHSYNIPPPRWGSDADVIYAVKDNAEKIYGIDGNTVGFSLPMFWGLPLLDRSGKDNHGTNQGATYKNNEFVFGGTNDRIDIDNIGSFRDFANIGPFTINLLVRNNLAATRRCIIGDWNAAGNVKTFSVEFGGWLQDSTHITTLMSQADTNLGYLDSGVVYDTVTYYHICVTFDGTTRTIFIQGEYKNSDTPPAWILPGAEANTTIGRAGGLNSLYLNGNLKFLNIFKSAINISQATLFNDLPYGLYQKVSRSFYLLPIAPSGWTGEIIGITNPSEILGRATTGISEVMGT